MYVHVYILNIPHAANILLDLSINCGDTRSSSIGDVAVDVRPVASIQESFDDISK